MVEQVFSGDILLAIIIKAASANPELIFLPLIICPNSWLSSSIPQVV